MTTRTIKNVDEETWKRLKEMARRKGLKMGELLKEISRVQKRLADSWSNILHAKPILTKEQAKSMLETVAKIRK